MKTVTNEFYEIKDKKGMYGLTYHVPTLEGAIVIAEQSNRDRIAQGYKAEEYIITRTAWARQYDDEGGFMFEDVHIEKVYPK